MCESRESGLTWVVKELEMQANWWDIRRRSSRFNVELYEKVFRNFWEYWWEWKWSQVSFDIVEFRHFRKRSYVSVLPNGRQGPFRSASEELMISIQVWPVHKKASLSTQLVKLTGPGCRTIISYEKRTRYWWNIVAIYALWGNNTVWKNGSLNLKQRKTIIWLWHLVILTKQLQILIQV